MPSDKRTTPERPRPASGSRPTQGNNRTTGPQLPGNGRPNRPEKRSLNLKSIGENIGWGLVIGLPVILVILAILWRATNGFQGTPDTTANLSTPVPTATAGVYVAPPVASGNKERLAYLQSDSPTSPMQIYSSRLDGSDVIPLTNSPQNKSNMAWSPDGKQVLFQADGAGIELVNFDGSGLHTVAYGAFNPVWSPDGKQIAFLKSVPAPDGQGPDRTGTIRVLYVSKVDGKPGDEKQLAADALGPNWSPDGKQIAFFSLRNAVMFTVEVETAKTTQIVAPNNLGGWYPTFSPDGKSLVFYGNPNPTSMVAGLDLSITAGSPANDAAVSPTATAGATIPVIPATVAPTQGAVTPTSGAQVLSTPGITVAGSPLPQSPVAIPSPTVIPGPPSQISLYSINRDGSGIKKLQDLEPVGGGGKFRFDYFIATSADQVSVLTARPYYKAGPVFSPDGKSVAALYVAPGDKTGLAIVPVDGSPANLVVEGQSGLEAGIRLNPSFSPDNARLYYSFVPAKPAATGPTPLAGVASVTGQQLKQSRYYEVGAKAEKTVFAKSDTSYVSCCGLRRN